MEIQHNIENNSYKLHIKGLVIELNDVEVKELFAKLDSRLKCFPTLDFDRAAE